MWLDTTSTTFTISQSQIKFGQLNSYTFEFASGLNLFVYLIGETHNISLKNVTFANNRGKYGNFYMKVHYRSAPDSSTDIDVNIQII